MGKYALLVGMNEYQDETLSQLVTPPNNVLKLAEILEDPTIGGYEVTKLINETESTAKRAIVRFFRDRQIDDTLIFYFSGHGILDEIGKLHLAVIDTEKDIPGATAINASDISSWMDRANSSRIIVIIDSCHSGAFDRSRMSSFEVPVHIGDSFRGNGHGRVVLTATDKTSYAWENDKILGDSSYSVFTQYLIEGIKTGQADSNHDGQISVSELHEYIEQSIAINNPKQFPQKFSYEQQGSLIIASNPFLHELPIELQQDIHSPRDVIRMGTITKLANLVKSKGLDENIKRRALNELIKLKQDADLDVAALATKTLDEIEKNYFQVLELTKVNANITQTQTITTSLPIVKNQDNTQFIFINYGSEDREFAIWIHDQLTELGYSVWLDRANIKGGDKWHEEIDKGIHNSFAVLTILTPTSVDSTREWILYEQHLAQKWFRPIIPLLLEDCELPQHLKTLNYIDFRSDWGGQLNLLSISIQEHLFRSGDSLTDETPSEGREFIGRDEELLEIFELMDEDHTPQAIRSTIAIQGMAGSGKTMVLRELARRLAPLYPGGVIFEQRGETQDSVQSVYKRWAQYVIGSYPDKEFSASEMRAMLSRYGEILVAFDDIWARDFENIEQLLEALPKDATKILTTQFKHEAQSIGCKIYELDQLNDVDAIKLVRNRLSDKPGPEPDVDLMKRLVNIVQGHPLAIELAAGRCDHTEDLEDLIEDLIEDLKFGVDVFESRVMNINATNSVKVSLGKSFQALQDADHRFSTNWSRCFISLGIFPDHVILTRDILAKTWGDTSRKQVSDTLSALTNRALIIRLTKKQYMLHPMIRAFARALLHEQQNEEYNQVRNHYVQYVTIYAKTRLARSPEQWKDIGWITPHIHHIGEILKTEIIQVFGDIEFLSQISPDAKSILAAAYMDDTIRNTLEIVSDFVYSILPYLRHRPEIGSIGKSWLQMGVIVTQRLLQHHRTALVMKELAWWYHESGLSRQAITYYEEALLFAEKANDQVLIASILGEKGYIRANAGDVDTNKAIELHDKALAIYRNSRDKDGEARILYYLGRDYWTQSLYDRALEYYEQSIDIKRDARILNAIGSGNFVKGDYELALKYFSESLEQSRRENNLLLEAENFNDMGAAYIYLENYESALVPLNNALLIHQKTGNRRLESITLTNIVAGLRGLKRYDEALKHANQAIKIAKEIETPKEESWASHQHALIYHQQEQFSKALESYENALNKVLEVENARTEAGIRSNLGWLLYEGYGRTKDALDNIERAIDLFNKHKLTRGHSNITLNETIQRRTHIIETK